jgi:hypothetical protein
MDPVSRAQLEVVPRKRHIIDPATGVNTQFKKGNPGGGRPRKNHITKIYEKILKNAKNREEIEQAIFETLKSGRMAGVLLLREAAERTEGKVSQEVEVSGNITMISDEELRLKLVEKLQKISA